MDPYSKLNRVAWWAIGAIGMLILLSSVGTLVVVNIQARVAEVVTMANRQIEIWEEIGRNISYAPIVLSSGLKNQALVADIRKRVKDRLSESEDLEALIKATINKKTNLFFLFDSVSEQQRVAELANVSAEIKTRVKKFSNYPDSLLGLGMAAWDSHLQIQLRSGNYLKPLRTLSNLAQPFVAKGLRRASIAILLMTMAVVAGLIIIRRWVLAPAFHLLRQQHAGLLSTQQQLNKQHEQFSAAFYAIRDAACIVKSDGRVQLYNEAFRELLDPSNQGAGLSSLKDIFDKIDEERIQDRSHRLRNCHTTEEACVALNELMVVFDDRRCFLWRCSKAGPDSWLIMALDQTALVKQKNEEAHTARLKALGQISGGIAHDFNNILANVLGRVELLLALNNDSKYASNIGKKEEGILHTMLETCERGRALTSQLLSFSRKQALAAVPVMTQTLASKICAEISVPPEVDWNVLCDVQAPLSIDHRFFLNSIENLVNNAVDALDGKPGHVTIRFSEDSLARGDRVYPAVRVTVSDTGKGFDEASFDNVYDPFFSTKLEENGTGLGLSMVHGFIEQSGGVIYHENLSQGAAVHLLLPISESPATVSQVVHRPVEETDSPKEVDSQKEMDIQSNRDKLVLILDDNQALGNFLAEFLAMHKFQAKVANTSQEGLVLLDECEYIDIAVCDWRLKKSTSQSFIDELQKRFPSTIVIVVTGYQDEELSRFARQRRIKVYQKPLSFKELATELELLKI